MDSIFTSLLDLPSTVKAYVVENADMTYTIVLNSRLNHEQNIKSYLHELSHIQNGDFEKYDVNQIEYNAHKDGM